MMPLLLFEHFYVEISFDVAAIDNVYSGARNSEVGRPFLDCRASSSCGYSISS